MSPDEQIREVYARFGLAVYHAQVLEHGIVNAMLVLRLPDQDRFTRRDIDAFMSQQFENTLGKLIKNLRAELPLPLHLEDALRQALKTRNWLCHEYFRERALDFMTEVGRDKMLVELVEASRLLSDADDSLTAVVQPLADRCGLTQEVLDAQLEAYRREQGLHV